MATESIWDRMSNSITTVLDDMVQYMDENEDTEDIGTHALDSSDRSDKEEDGAFSIFNLLGVGGSMMEDDNMILLQHQQPPSARANVSSDDSPAHILRKTHLQLNERGQKLDRLGHAVDATENRASAIRRQAAELHMESARNPDRACCVIL